MCESRSPSRGRDSSGAVPTSSPEIGGGAGGGDLKVVEAIDSDSTDSALEHRNWGQTRRVDRVQLGSKKLGQTPPSFAKASEGKPGYDPNFDPNFRYSAPAASSTLMKSCRP